MSPIVEMATHFLQDLIRIDTSNPPGNELPAATYIAEVLSREGIEPAVVESAPGRETSWLVCRAAVPKVPCC